MLYRIYHEYLEKRAEAQRKYDEILAEKEQLFAKTQPKSVKYRDSKISGGSRENAFDSYLISKERASIDERLKEIKSILADRTNLVELKEQELRASKDYYDRVYVGYYLDRLTVSKMVRYLPYGSSQVFRMLDVISRECHIEKPRIHRRKLGVRGTKYVVKYKIRGNENGAKKTGIIL